MARLAARAVIVASSVVAVFLLLLLAASAGEVTPGVIPRPAIPVFLISSVGLPLAFVHG